MMVSGAIVSIATKSLLAGVNRPSDTKLSTIVLDFFWINIFFLQLALRLIWWRGLFLKVTVMTSQSGRGVVRRLETALRDADVVSLRRLLVVQILTDADWGQDSSSPEATPTQTEGQDSQKQTLDDLILWNHPSC